MTCALCILSGHLTLVPRIVLLISWMSLTSIFIHDSQSVTRRCHPNNTLDNFPTSATCPCSQRTVLSLTGLRLWESPPLFLHSSLSSVPLFPSLQFAYPDHLFLLIRLFMCLSSSSAPFLLSAPLPLQARPVCHHVRRPFLVVQHLTLTLHKHLLTFLPLPI